MPASLSAQLAEIERGVIDSSGFETLPQPMQDVVRASLRTARQSMPTLIGVVQKRLTAWKRVQRNSSAQETARGRRLSKGGSPRLHHTLYKLSDGANGTGIDSVWRAGGHNGGKPYAMVEAKATRDEDAPKFMRKPGNTRKPSITSTLGANAITDPSELLEPLEEDGTSASVKTGGGKTGGKNPGRKAVPSGGKPKVSGGDSAGKAASSATSKRTVLVQMSREWIDTNIDKAVGPVAASIRREGYARHLLFSPAYHPSGSPLAHMKAKLNNLPPEEHAGHEAFRYDDGEVKTAVNKRKAQLRKKYGNLPSLRDEQ